MSKRFPIPAFAYEQYKNMEWAAPALLSAEEQTRRAAAAKSGSEDAYGCYPVDADGLVRVPLEAVGPLIGKGGFAEPKTAGEMFSAGLLKLHHGDAAGCSYGGQQYPGDENGDVLVPAEATAELLAHGFVPVLQGATSTSRRTKPVPVNLPIKG